jgi:hypothetical protein
MEELTDVVRLAEAKQRQRNDADIDVGRGGEQGRKNFSSPSGAKIRPASAAHAACGRAAAWP